MANNGSLGDDVLHRARQVMQHLWDGKGALEHRVFTLGYRLLKARGEKRKPEIDPESVGEVRGSVFWPAKARGFGAWAGAWAAVTTEATGPRALERAAKALKTITRAQADAEAEGVPRGDRRVKVRPVKDGEFAADERYDEVSASAPAGDPLPKGSPGVVLLATDEREQVEIFLPTGFRLVAVHRAGDPKVSSLVSDTDDESAIDKDHRAPLHSALHVIRLAPGSPVGLAGDAVLAHQLTSATQDGISGHGLWYGRENSGSAAAAAPDPAPKHPDESITNGSRDGQSGNVTGPQELLDLLQRAAQDSGGDRGGAVTIGGTGVYADGPTRERARTQEQLDGARNPDQTRERTKPGEGDKTRERPRLGTAIGATSAEVGGPWDVGGPGCPHEIGTTLDGEPIRSMHLSGDALIRTQGADGPLHLELGYADPGEQPWKSRGHLMWDPSTPHNHPLGPKPGKWKILCESMLLPPDDDPPPPEDPPGGPGSGGFPGAGGTGGGGPPGGPPGAGAGGPPGAGAGAGGPGAGSGGGSGGSGSGGFGGPDGKLHIWAGSLYWGGSGKKDVRYAAGVGAVVDGYQVGVAGLALGSTVSPDNVGAAAAVKSANARPGTTFVGGSPDQRRVFAAASYMLSAPGLALRATPTANGEIDYTRSSQLDADARRKMAGFPLSAEILAYAAGDGTALGYSYAAGSGPAAGTTPLASAGGVVFAPPGNTLANAIAQEITGEASFVMPPGTRTAYGYPADDGGMKGGVAVGASGGSLVFDLYDGGGNYVSSPLVIGEGGVLVNGKLDVSGSIDPTDLQLNPQASNPIAAGARYGLWVRNSDKALLYSKAGTLIELGAGGSGASLVRHSYPWPLRRDFASHTEGSFGFFDRESVIHWPGWTLTQQDEASTSGNNAIAWGYGEELDGTTSRRTTYFQFTVNTEETYFPEFDLRCAIPEDFTTWDTNGLVLRCRITLGAGGAGSALDTGQVTIEVFDPTTASDTVVATASRSRTAADADETGYVDLQITGATLNAITNPHAAGDMLHMRITLDGDFGWGANTPTIRLGRLSAHFG